VFEDILTSITPENLEIVCNRSFRVSIALIPSVEDFLDFNPDVSQKEAARGLICLVAGITLDLYWDEFHKLNLLLENSRC